MKTIRIFYQVLKAIKRLNLIKTLYINLKFLPIKQALKFPILLYGKVNLLNLSGSIEILSKIETGMIKIGYRWIDLWPVSFFPTQIQIVGKLQFYGKSIFSGGVNLNVQSKTAELKIGNFTVIGGGSVVKCLEKIEIMDGTRITGNCMIMDCNMHFVKNIDTGVISNYKEKIVIGKKCWINYGSVISKGTIIPDGSITSRNSYLSKDYSIYGTNLFLIGSPAKPASYKVQRIFTIEKQKEFAEYFKKHEVSSLRLNAGEEFDEGHMEGF